MNGLSAAASAVFLVAAFACQVRISYAFLYQVDASRPKGRFLNASCPTNGVSHQQDDICPQYSLPPIRHSVSVFSRLLHSEESGIFPEGDTTSIKSRELSNLPRLYTGPSIFGQAESTLSIAKGTRIQLSAEQSHYLKNVMRIFKKKQRKKTLAGANDTLSRCVRIFDGKSGEWLARVFETPEVSAQHGEGGANGAVGYRTDDDLAQSTGAQPVTMDIGNGNDEVGSGYIHLFNPSSTTFVKHFIVNANSYHGLGASLNAYTAGYYNSQSAIDAIQFKMDSGNIDAGTISLYGVV